MNDVLVYAAERDAGLAGAVRAQVSVALAGSLRRCEPFKVEPGVLRATQQGAPELYYFESVLVTAGWKPQGEKGLPAGCNNNDDLFDGLEVWLARDTPANKPVNYEHDCADVIGHIISNRPVAEDGSTVDCASAADEIPAKFHLVTSSVLYKLWDRADLQERMDGILAAVADSEWYVSMECRFRGFDYGVAQEDGTFKVVARNKDTAFLTRRLRAYGGDGLYESRKVVRVLRNITFSGKGLVKRPANPESVIFNSSAAEFSVKPVQEVYSPVSGKAIHEERLQPMSVEIEKQLEALRAENEKLQAQVRDGDTKVVTQAREKAEALALAHKTKLDEVLLTLAARDEALKVATLRAETAEASLVSVQTRLDKIEEASKQAKRLAAVKATLKTNEGDEKSLAVALKLAGSLAALSDEQFVANLEALAQAGVSMMTAPPPTNDPQGGNTTFPGGTAKPAPKATSAPLPPKQTSLPAPMSGKGSSDTAQLETVVVEPAAALGTETDQGAEVLRKAIATYFGCEDETPAK